MVTKMNIYILSIFLKQHNFLIILIVISATSVLSTWRNLHLKSTTYKLLYELFSYIWTVWTVIS